MANLWKLFQENLQRGILAAWERQGYKNGPEI